MKDYGDSDPAQDTNKHLRLHQKSEEVVHWLSLNDKGQRRPQAVRAGPIC